MAIGRSRKSSSRSKKGLKRREESRRQFARRSLRIESLEERQLLAVGPQLIGVQPNQGDLLDDGDIRNVSPQELTFHFNEGQVIDASTLDAIKITGSGFDFQFDSASARTDFNTNGLVVVEFSAKSPGPNGNDITFLFSKRDMGGPASPAITVEGKTIFVELNTNQRNATTADALVSVLNAHVETKNLVEAVVVSGSKTTNIATSSITYSPLDLAGANTASVTSNFNTGTKLEVTFTAVQSGREANGITIEVTKHDFGGAADPSIDVDDDGVIHIQLNTSLGNATTAEQLVSAFNINAEARALVVASNPVGAPTTNIATPAINYSPLVLGGASDIDITPGYVGLGNSAREVVFRFAEPLPDDVYRVDIQGVGSTPLRNDLGFALGDTTDDDIDNGQDYSLEFELDLGAQILGVVPQPIVRTSNGVLSQSTSQIEVYFNDDDLDPVSATNPAFYQLIHVNETVETGDDDVYHPIAVQYFPDSDRAMLTFLAPLHQLGSGPGTFRLRIGTDEQTPAPPVMFDLTGDDAGSSFDTARDLDALLGADGLTGSMIVSAKIDPQVYALEFPGSNDEPGHRAIPENVETHLIQAADSESGIGTVFYNFRDDYGKDPGGNTLSNLITDDQMQRAREIFEIYGQELGVQFVETASQGITIVTGDLRALDPEIATGPGGVIGLSGASPITGQPTVIMDAAEDWYAAFGVSDDPLRPESWFDTAMHEVGHQLGLGHTYELAPGTLMGSEPELAFGVVPEPVFPGDEDIVHGQHLYRTEGQDIDLYRFTIQQSGLFTAETIAERQNDSSLLDSVIALYRQDGEQWELIARNDDYYSNDSFLEMALEPGEYYLGVSAAGNESYNPIVADTGFGGRSEGKYDLRLTFREDAFNSILDRDNAGEQAAGIVSAATALDGDGDGIPGGVYNFWFRVDSTPIIVDKAAATGGSGNLTSPFINIDDALAVARPGDVIRIVGNGGVDGDLGTPEDNLPYEIGFDALSRPLEDGSTLNVPRGVTVMIDRGAVIKLRRARIGVGSSAPTIDRNGGALQVLGTPRLVDIAGQVVEDGNGNQIPGSVYFTSLNDESLGGDSNPSLSTSPQAGEWGGLVFRNDLDRALGRFDWEQEGIFLNYVNQADIRYGGGTVVVDSVPQIIAPIHATDARPTISYNTITDSADAAISANPDSFEETNFHSPEYQAVPFTSDYSRIGPNIRGNRLIDNSINGLFVRMKTPSGNQTEKLTVSGRWDDTGIVHVVSETLRIQGNPGGPIQLLDAPDATLVALETQPDGTVPVGIVDYKITFVDADGNEGPASDPTDSVLVDATDIAAGVSVRLDDLPTAPAGYVGRNLYRSVKSEYVLVVELNATDRSYVDDGTTVGGLLQGSTLDLTARLRGRLAVDPGTVVKLNGAGIETGFGAQLIAEGVDGLEVVFTSLQDSRYGAGGTFETSDRGDLASGNWTGLYVGHTSSASIDYAVLAYGGGIAEIPGSFAGFNALEIHQAEARVTNTRFEFNAAGVGGQATANRDGRGPNSEALIFVRGAQPIIVDNTMVENAGLAISINLNSLNHTLLTDYGRSTGSIDLKDSIVDNQGPLIRGNRLAQNDFNGMQVRGGTLTTQGVWDDTDIVHIVLEDTIYVPDFHTYGGLRLESSGTESLVVKLSGADAGFTAVGRPLDITDRIGGALQIIGQPGFPVVLTSIQDDRASAGFQPDGTAQSDTNNNGDPFVDGGDVIVTLPTGPEVDNGLIIDNDVNPSIPGFFQVEPSAGGSIGILANDAVTALGNTQLYTAADFIFNFLNYVDVGAGAGVLLDTTTVTVPPTLQTNPLQDIVTSEGNFVGDNNQQINWHVESRFDNGVPIYFNTVTFATNDPNQTLGDLQFSNYLDEDVTMAFDILALTGTPGAADFRAFTMGDLDRVGFSHGGIYEPGPGLVNATFDGWAADVYPLLDMAVATSAATYSVPGNINLLNLPAVPDPNFGTVYGPRDVTTAFAWSVDPTANTATITTFLELLPRDPTLVEPNFAGDWRSIELQEYSHDRNVATITERETGNATITGINETAEQAQVLGQLAPEEKAADDNRRLGFEIHGALNRPSDADVYTFEAVAGTEIWLDIDRTTNSLDSVLELIDRNGNVLARSDNSGAEAGDPSLLYFDPAVMSVSEVNPLAKSLANGEDLWTTNPRDAGMRVALPGPAGTTNSYHVRVRSSSKDLSDVEGGLTFGAYQLQIRLREIDEVPGSTIDTADIRYATNGIEVSGLPAHSPLTGEAAEVLDATGADDNNSLVTADVLGNLLNTDRGTLSVAGKIAAADDVDWYQFDVAYDSIQSQDSIDPRHLSTIFDIDYADGFARANTNLWVFDDLGQLVLVGGDSNTPEDRPASTNPSIDDLGRGSVGAGDPFIGAVELPATGFQPGRYYVAVSSNAQLPDQLDQYLTAAATNPFVRLEPINSVNRIAEDHIDSAGNYTTAEQPEIPVLFGADDQVSLFVPDGTKMKDGERLNVASASGNSVTYEFDSNGSTSIGSIPVPYEFGYSADEMGAVLALVITTNPPDTVDFTGSFQPTPGSPLMYSSVSAYTLGGGEVVLSEFVYVETLLNEVTTSDFFTGQLVVTPITRTSTYVADPVVRQAAAPGQKDATVYVSRPAAVPYDLGDVTLFVSDPGALGSLNSTELLSVDPFTGQVETRVGAFGANVGDIAMQPGGSLPGGGLFAYEIPQGVVLADDNTDNYWQIDPGTLTDATTGANLGVQVGDGGIQTYHQDPANPGTEIRSGVNNKNGVGVLFDALTFSNEDVDTTVRGFAVGTRGDTFVDPTTGNVFSGALGIPNPANILFEFAPNTGAALNPPNTADRTGPAILTSGGTQIVDRGGLDTTVDAFPAGGSNNTITGVDATTVDIFGLTQVNVEDGDYFEIDQDGDRVGDITFEFDTGPEFFMTITAASYLVDGDTFIVDGVQFEFDTGSVIIVTAQNGSVLNDGDTMTITDNSVTPSTMTFEFDNDNNTAGGTPIPFGNASNQQAIISSIISSINSVGNFGVTAQQLPGTSRITLLGESTVSGVATNAAGVTTGNSYPGVGPASIRVPVEETFTEDEIGQAIATVIDGTQTGGFQAGAVGDRLNFMGALTASFAGVTNPVFAAGGVQGTLGQFNLPVPFLASDNSAAIAGRVHQAVVSAGFDATLSGATVFLNPVSLSDPQPTFVCNSLGTPPLIGAIGVPDCPLQSGGVAPGGTITGIAFLGSQLYGVTDAGGLYRVVDSTGLQFDPDSQYNVADYIDGSRELLASVNEVTTLTFDPLTGQFVEVTSEEPIRFSGLVAGPQNTENGLYENLLFGITDTGRLFAFDTYGEPQAIFANGAYHVETGLTPNGLAFGTLDDNLWHVTDFRDTDTGHGITGAFDGSRIQENALGNTSFYFGYEDSTVQPQFGDNAFAPATQANTYDFPGGAHGSLESNTFSLRGYSSADKPTLYFNYFLETEQADTTNDTTLDDPLETMRDAFRVYISGDDGQWKLLSTNNSARDPLPDDDYFDEYDPFDRFDPVTGEFIPEQPFDRAETFDNTGNWRQARIDLGPYAGQGNLRLRFDFSTAGGLSSGGGDVTLDLNTAGNQLRAIPGNELRDGQMFTLTGIGVDPTTGFGQYATVAGFEFDLGPTIVAPTGGAIDDGSLFDLDGKIYEFDKNGIVGATNSIPHTAIEFVGTETAGELAGLIQTALEMDPPPPLELIGDLTGWEPNETLETSFATGLNGTTQIFDGTGTIGDNFDLADPTLDVDMVELNLDAGDTVSITTNTARLATQLDSYLRLFDADGNELRTNDNADPTNPFSRDSRIDFTATARGKYYVGISAAHNVNYSPIAAGSGVANGDVVTRGFYEFTIAVTDPVGPVLVGNRLNIPNAGTITTSGLPGNFVDGAKGVRDGLPNPLADNDATLPDLPVVPVRVYAGMSTLHVADAIRTAMAEYLNTENEAAIKTQHEVVQIVGYGIGDAGPLGISGPSDPATAIPGSGLFGDMFGAFDTSAAFDGQTSRQNPGALRMQDNQYEGVHVDDIVIGFAARGEMVTTPDSNPALVTSFIPNNNQPVGDIDQGAYQLEIRQATEYGLSLDAPDPSLLLYDSFDVNDRLADGISLAASSGDLYRDGQTFSISDGAHAVTFEFIDLTVDDRVATENEEIAFSPGDNDAVMARRIRDAINRVAKAGLLDAKATSSDGTVTGSASTSNLVHLYGDITVAIGLSAGGPLGQMPVPEVNDTLSTAIVTGIIAEGREDFRGRGVIGDNPELGKFGADVDLFEIELAAGEAIVADIDASEFGSTLDSLLRVFDATGNPLLAVDQNGVSHPVQSDDDLAPGEDFLLLPQLELNYDSYVAFIAPADGTYYIGVSGFGNDAYDSTVADSGRAGSMGEYEIHIQRPAVSNGLDLVAYVGKGDKNLFRDQGQVLLRANQISDSSEFGILVSAGSRQTGEASHPGSVRNLSQINTANLAPGVTITNNILAKNALGGIDLSGDPGDITGLGEQPAVVPFARVINNTIVGRTGENGISLGDVGIRIQNNMSPTLLNNVVSGLGTGIEVDATSSTTILGGTLYHNNAVNIVGRGMGDFPMIVDPTTPLFVNPDGGNYYPAEFSPIIDSAVDSMEDRPEMVQIQNPLGITKSPILAPQYDASGQLRVDDPSVFPPSGLGENVFKDRGAQDRADFDGPTASLLSPLDNGAGDQDPAETLVNLFRTTLNEFSIQLVDNFGPIAGIGVDDTTVSGYAVSVTQNGRLLVEGDDYSFRYDATNNIIRLTPLAGVWESESSYIIELNTADRFVVQGLSGDMVAEGDSFDVVDEIGNTTSFEYDTGYVLQVPQTLAVQVPPATTKLPSVSDGDTITVQQNGKSFTVELDDNGAVIAGNEIVEFTADTSQGELADAIAAALSLSGLGLTPSNTGDGLVHLGVDGTQTLTVVSATMMAVGVEQGVTDIDTFTIDNGGQVVTFEFTRDPSVGQGRVGIQFSYADTHDEIAESIALAINKTSLGLSTTAISDGRVHVGGSLNHLVDVTDSHLALTGQPGATLAWGLRIPTSAGRFQELVNDGDTFVITSGIGKSVTFEFDDNQDVTPGNTALPFTVATTTAQLADTLVSRIRNAGLGLYPFNSGNGIVVLGGDATYSMDVLNTSLVEVGLPGVPAATAIAFTPDESFSAEQLAEATAQAINNRHLPGVTANAVGDQTIITGASDVVGANAEFVSGVKDKAGNLLRGNQVDGDTRFSIYVGAGMDYGDAPASYGVLRANNGARHVLLPGFSLGQLVDIDADGKPTVGADGDDLDGDDEDGVLFDPSTPLVPNRFYNIFVSTSGIGNGVDDVASFGALDAWIDFNGDGDWNDANEQILKNVILNSSSLNNGIIAFRDLRVPANAVAGVTYARFRLSTEGNLSPTGEATAGEVEDHLITIITNPWQNPTNKYDVNNSGASSPVDLLLLINHLNQNPNNPYLPVPKPANSFFLDVNGDGYITSIDVLEEVTELNRLNDSQGQGEGEFDGKSVRNQTPRNHLDDILGDEDGWLDIVSDVGEAAQPANARDAFFAVLGD